MSLTHDVCFLIRKKGSATVDSLLSELPGYTRSQVMNAMKNARTLGLIHTLNWANRNGKNVGQGRAPSAYYPGPKPTFYGLQPIEQPERDIKARPPASVWELGHGLQIAGDWPPAFEGGRVFVPAEDDE